ncbi:MAG: FAD-dependent oxidoreductase [Acidobacteriia bacterium]|nr:FAD-dependent oxidoreductase [Methyloceanibacter sp.]MCL6490979.1 FAD-dependent oxidoreductase [Terriglobia bacterium]
MTERNQHFCDVLVLGSGAGGLSTAVTARKLGLDVLVAEKEKRIGGTTARSGGWLWIPNNPLAKAAGIADSVAAARSYLQHEAGNHFDAERVDAFLRYGPEMVDFFTRETAVQFVLGPEFSDYHPNAPGGLPGGRSICAAPFDARVLGPEIKRLAPPLPEITFLGMMIGSGKELLHFFNVTRSPRSAAYVSLLLARYARDRMFYGRGMRLTNGNALAARLLKSASDLSIPIWTESPATALIVEKGAVRGAIVQRQGIPVEVFARRAVVLATGGFPHDPVRRARLYPHGQKSEEIFSPTPAGNTGDGLRLAEQAGAAVVEGYPNPAAWVPISRVPWRDGHAGAFPHFIDRAKPGVIAVTRAGRRFVNEANSYHDFIQGLFRATEGKAEPEAFLLCDHATIRRYGLGFAKPAPVPIGLYVRSGYLLRGRSLEELAAKAGIDPKALAETVARYNEAARRGEDPEFGRGSTAYNRYLGDPAHRPNPNVAPLEKAPFYAVRVVPGELGTFAGLATDAHARVLDAAGNPIPGLYAAGNDLASIMGGNYPGGGITLGPAMTFGYIAARHIAAAQTSDTSHPVCVQTE